MNNRLFSVAVLGLALGLAGSTAVAQYATFTLPYAVHVGKATLQPGDYRITLPSSTSVIGAVYLYGNGTVQAALPSSIEYWAPSSDSYLELVNAGGTYFVHKFSSGATGKTYTFPVPKAAQRQVLANTRATTISVTGGTSN
jgi:hypothetical protein